MKHLNRPIARKDIQLPIKKLSQKKSPNLDLSYHGKFNQTFKINFKKFSQFKKIIKRKIILTMQLMRAVAL